MKWDMTKFSFKKRTSIQTADNRIFKQFQFVPFSTTQDIILFKNLLKVIMKRKLDNILHKKNVTLHDSVLLELTKVYASSSKSLVFNI